MTAPIDELYLEWLYAEIGDVKLTQKSRTYWSLTRHLLKTEFLWSVPNDDNRIEDGKDLRREFLSMAWIEHPDPGWAELGCSMLELLIGLSRRLVFEAEGTVDSWFWHLLSNIGLKHYNDRTYPGNEGRVDDALDMVVFRTYDRDGNGGLFPLATHPHRDQRRVELWYQLSAYLVERIE